MKRIITILLCLCLVVALAIPALAADLYPEDYIVGIDGDIVSYDIPADEFYDYTLEYLNSNGTQSLRKVWGEPLEYTFSSTQNVWVVVSPFAEGDFLYIEDFPTTSRVRFNIRFSAQGGSNTSAARVRYQIRWFNADYEMIKYEVTDFTVPDGNLFGQYVTLSKPDDAVFLTMIAQVNDLRIIAGTTYFFDFLGFQFQMSKSDLAALEAEVGKTNKLLESVINYKPEATPPPFNDGLTDSMDREDGILDNFQDGTLENFGGNIVDASDYLGQFAATFAFVQDMWEPLIQLPWLNTILVASLGLGLLGGFLGIFVTTSRTESKGRGDD